jgi:hypothetical protein
MLISLRSIYIGCGHLTLGTLGIKFPITPERMFVSSGKRNSPVWVKILRLPSRLTFGSLSFLEGVLYFARWYFTFLDTLYHR